MSDPVTDQSKDDAVVAQVGQHAQSEDVNFAKLLCTDIPALVAIADKRGRALREAEKERRRLMFLIATLIHSNGGKLSLSDREAVCHSPNDSGLTIHQVENPQDRRTDFYVTCEHFKFARIRETLGGE